MDEKMDNVAVLCTRVRVEEKYVMAALAAAGIPAVHISPDPEPLPIRRESLASSIRPAVNLVTPFDGASTPGIAIDRMQNRTIGSAIVRTHRALGTVMIDSGLAATGSRLDVMHALSAAGLPLPPTLLALSEQAGLEAIERIGYPATLFPMQIGLSGIGIQDREIAEAILEHRETLGSSSESVLLVQAGHYEETDLIKAIVVDGVLVAYEGVCHHPAGFSGCEELATAAAAALEASFVGVTLAHTVSGLVVWDVRPIPDFRHSIPSGEESVASALAIAVGRRLAVDSILGSTMRAPMARVIGTLDRGNDVVLSA